MNQYEYFAKRELFKVLRRESAFEVAFLRQAIIDSRIDGETYCESLDEVGTCACLYGTLAIASLTEEGTPFKCDEEAYEIQERIDEIALRSNVIIAKNNRGEFSHLEDFVLYIKPGDTLSDNPRMNTLLEWVDEFIANPNAVV